jgi:hypothetical protein
MDDIRKIRAVTDNPLVEDVLRKREAPKKKRGNGFEEELKRQEAEMGEDAGSQPVKKKPSPKKRKKKVPDDDDPGKIKGRIDIKA